MSKEEESLKRVLAAALALCLALGVLPLGAAAADADTVASTIRAMGVMTGHDNGDMDLDGYVTRAQFTKMMAMASSYRDTVGEAGSLSLFSDVRSTHWAAEYVRVAVEQGWVQGYSDGTFRPDQTITAEEACTALLRMLGYTNEDLAGTYPNAQLSKARSLGLDDGFTMARGQRLTRRDAVYLFYNLMTAQTKSGAVYATAVGYSLTASGELDYNAVVRENLEGPYTLSPGEIIPYAQAAVYRDGEPSSPDGLGAYDIWYYSGNLNTVYAYSARATGTYTAASPSQVSPSTVTVAGVSYTLGTAAAVQKMSTLGRFSYGDQVTLLLGMDGTVADVISASDSAEVVYGVVTATGSQSYPVAGGAVSASRTVSVACTDGVVRQYAVSSDSYEPGDLVSVSYSGSQNGVRRLSERSVSGKVNRDGTKLGSLKLAENVEILDSDGSGGWCVVYPQRLAGAALSGGDVRYYAENEDGEIDYLILEDVTGDLGSYVVLTDVTEISDMQSMAGSYQWIQDGVPGQAAVQRKNFGVETGGARVLYEDGAVASIRNLRSVTLTDLTAATAQTRDGSYEVWERAQVYIRSGSTYSLVNAATVDDPDEYRLTGWYDDFGCSAGGLIRIIVATEK